MKRYIILSLTFGYLCLIVSGTTGGTFNGATKAEKSFSNTVNSGKTFTNATDLKLSSSNTIVLEKSSNNSTNFEKSPTNATDISVSKWKNFPYVIQYGTNPELQYGFKSKIKGGFKKIKNKVKDGFKKVKDIGKDLLKNKVKDLLNNKVKDLLKNKIPIPINSGNSDLTSFPYIIQNGTNIKFQKGIKSKLNGASLELFSHNAIDLEASSNNSPNLEKSSTKATDFKVSPWKYFPYIIQNGTNPELQQSIETKIKGDFNKMKHNFNTRKNHVKDFEGYDKTKDEIIDLEKNEYMDIRTNDNSSSLNLNVYAWNYFLYALQNGTDPQLQHGIKSKIKGGFNKIKNKVKDFGNKVKNKISGIGTGGNSGNYGRYRYRRPVSNNGSYSGNTSTILYIILGTIGTVILIFAFAYCMSSSRKEIDIEKC